MRPTSPLTMGSTKVALRRHSLLPCALPHSLSYLPRSLPRERECARHGLHCWLPELHAAVFSITPAAPPLSLTTLASFPSCTAPPHMGQPATATLAPAMVAGALLHGCRHGLLASAHPRA
jgi:hypothetical protein